MVFFDFMLWFGVLGLDGSVAGGLKVLVAEERREAPSQFSFHPFLSLLITTELRKNMALIPVIEQRKTT